LSPRWHKTRQTCLRGMTAQRSSQLLISCALRLTKLAQSLCRPKNASRPSTRTVRCGSSTPCTRKWFTVLSAFRQWSQRPELKEREPFKNVLSGNREEMAKLSLHDLEEILFATLTGMPVEVFEAEAKKW